MKDLSTVVVLGAGASRAVSYANKGGCPSPLDADFFDLLQRSKPTPADHSAVEKILQKVRLLPSDHWRSMERSFYTLQLRAYMHDKLTGAKSAQSDAIVVRNFARCVQSLLRSAHGKGICDHHRRLLTPLKGLDAVISFNYDLVVERALRPIADGREVSFAPEIYGFGKEWELNLPLILKLHGSSNWKIKTGQLVSRTNYWDDFNETPGYRGHIGSGSSFPIFLPFWDKRIEQGPWLSIWTRAYEKLRGSGRLIVWGYSLPPTDIKAQSLFTLALEKKDIDLCVIDPSSSTRERWRQMLPRARYWEYDGIRDFFQEAPSWWPEPDDEMKPHKA